MHAAQTLIVAILVPLCTLYAVWKLMPMAARRALALVLLRLPHWPHRLEATLHRAAQVRSGCGCDGCDHAAPKPSAAAATAAPQPIVFHRRGSR